MTERETELERRIARALRADAEAARPRVRASELAERAMAGRQRRSLRPALAFDWPRPSVGLLLILLLLGLALAALALWAPPEPERPIGSVAYVDADGDLWTMPVESGQPTLLLDTPDLVMHAAWSPDGRWLLASTLPNEDIWLVRADGTDATRLGTGREAIWSHDGRSVAFVALTANGTRPVLRDLATGTDSVLALPPGMGGAAIAGWLDDQHLLVRACEGCAATPGGPARWFVVPEGGPTVHPPDPTTDPVLSPDGRLMAWSPCDDLDRPCDGVFVRDLATGADRHIESGPDFAFGPLVWSPDGRWVIHPSGNVEGSAARLVRAAADGSGVATIEEGAQGGLASAHGGWMVVMRPDGDSGWSGGWLVRADGTEARPLVSPPIRDVVAWSRVPLGAGVEDPADPTPVAASPAPGCARVVLMGGDPVVHAGSSDACMELEYPGAPFDVDGDGAPDGRWDETLPEALDSRMLTGRDGPLPIGPCADPVSEAGRSPAASPGPTATPSPAVTVSSSGPDAGWCVVGTSGARFHLRVVPPWEPGRALRVGIESVDGEVGVLGKPR